MNPTADRTRPSRRAFIRLLGGGAVLAAGAASVGCSTEFPAAAVQPWQDAAREQDLRRFLLAHALLAPNSHNRQPWIADLREPGRIHLVCDGGRLLPETDPFGRQILIGCGAFLELAVLAAAARGVAAGVTLFPDGPPPDGQPLPARGVRVATLALGGPGSAAPDPLFEAVLRRRTNKTAYDNARPVPPALVEAWGATAGRFGMRWGLAAGEAAMAPIRRITREAFEIETLTPRTWLESARLLRIGPQAIAEHRDGISINGAMPRLAYAMGMFDPLKVPQRGDSSMKRLMDHWASHETGSGYLWLAGPDNSRATQVAAGRAYVRMHLQATVAGADMHPLSQALQEFPEVRGPFDALHRQLGADPAVAPLQMLARVGFALAPAGPSPRRPLEALLHA
jgi:hypothetical protein